MLNNSYRYPIEVKLRYWSTRCSRLLSCLMKSSSDESDVLAIQKLTPSRLMTLWTEWFSEQSKLTEIMKKINEKENIKRALTLFILINYARCCMYPWILNIYVLRCLLLLLGSLLVIGGSWCLLVDLDAYWWVFSFIGDLLVILDALVKSSLSNKKFTISFIIYNLAHNLFYNLHT